MADEPDVYSYLATSKVSEVTLTQLEQSLENSFINKRNIESWKGPITVHRLLEVSRTYPWGLPIPEAGAVTVSVIGALETYLIQPPGTEIWDIKHVRLVGAGGTATAEIAFTDGVSDCIIASAASVPAVGTDLDLNDQISSPVLLTNSLYLKVTETGGSFGIQIQLAYHVVSL